MPLTMKVTDVGRAAIVNAQNTGTDPVTITQFGISETAIVPDGTETALAGEMKRVATLSGDIVDDDTIHLIVRDESADAFDMRSWGLYLADGTLFAVYGQADPILSKTAQSMMLMAVDVRFADIDAAALTFGDTNFLNPPATTEAQGVVELATSAEGQTGTDLVRAMTPKAVKDAVTAWLDARFGVNNALVWNPNNDGSGSGLDADLLDGKQSAEFLLKIGGVVTGDILGPSFSLSGGGSFKSYSAGAIAALISGTVSGTLIEGVDAGHVVVALRSNDSSDSFAVVADANYDGTYDTVAFRVRRSGEADFGSAIIRAAGNQLWHAGNVGPGSSLDADTVDGIQGASIARKDVSETFTGLITVARDSAEQLRLGSSTGGVRDVYLSFYDGLATRRGYLQALSNHLLLRRDGGAGFELYGSGDARIDGSQIMHHGNDGPGSGFNADMLDNYHASSFLLASAYTAADVLAKLLTVDGAASGINADLLDNQHGSYYADIPARMGVAGSAPIYAARAWVNFTGSGTVSIRNSGNVSSVTDNGAGRYTVNFATALPDGNYAAAISIGTGSQTVDAESNNYKPFTGVYAAGSFSFSLYADDDVTRDFSYVSVIFVR